MRKVQFTHELRCAIVNLNADPAMNIRHLRYFLEVVSTGSLRRASEVLYVTQSALSRAVSELESELGCMLLERERRGVKATRHGLVFLVGARRILAEVDSLKSQLLEEKSQPVGHVRLAMPVGVRTRLTLPLVRRLRGAYPNVRVDIADGNAHENRAAVLDGTADITVIQELDRGLPLNYRRLYSDALCLVGPHEAGLRMDTPVRLAALAEHPLLSIRAPNQIRWTVDAALRRLKASTEPAMEVSSSLLLLDLVEEGHGYTVLPESLLLDAIQNRRISAARLDKLNVTWVAAWQKGKPLSRAVQIALDTLLVIA